jgi:hypothetical protein
MNSLKMITFLFITTTLSTGWTMQEEDKNDTNDESLNKKSTLTLYGSSSEDGNQQELSQAEKEFLENVSKAPTFAEAMELVAATYPGEDILEFFAGPAYARFDIFLGLFKKLIKDQYQVEDLNQLTKEQKAQISREMITTVATLSRDDLGTYPYNTLKADFLVALFGQEVLPGVKENALKYLQQRKDAKKRLYQFLNDLPSSGGTSLDSIKYLSQHLPNIYSVLINTSEFVRYIMDYLTAQIPGDPKERTLELAQAAETLYNEVISLCKGILPAQKEEFLGHVLNSFYMEIDGLSKQQRLVKALPLILSDKGFALEYLKPILRNCNG